MKFLSLPAGCHVACAAAALLVCLMASSAARADAAGAPAPSNATIEQLIQTLGAPEYAQREKARDELRQLGVVAFEALHAAQFHADVEIRKQAEYLLRAIRISWIQADDPDEVKQLLRRYHEEEYDERLVHLRELGRVENGRSIAALCRLARFETSEVLSKQAALTVMRYDLTGHKVDPKQMSRAIDPVLGNSQRTAVTWLQTYSRYLHNPEETLAEWQRLTAIEAEAVRQRPDKDRLALLQDLFRWQIEMLQRLGRDTEMLAVLQQLLPLQGNSRDEILHTVEWLLQRGAWSLIDDMVKAFPGPFQDDPFLLYRQAEAAIRQGRAEEAAKLVTRALAKKADDEPFLHVELGVDLQGRGLIDWAEKEYRHAIETSEQGTHPPVEAAIRLGWMLHDLSRNREAYEAFKQLVSLMDKDKAVLRRVQELNRIPDQVKGQMHFSRALDLADQQKWDEHRAALEEALNCDQENADVLIAMYRVPQADDMWRQKTKERIERLRELYGQQVARAQRDALAVPGLSTNRTLAQALNQYAWLISNTEGDYAAALRSSRRSLQLIDENAGYLDTLARCHYAVGDFAAAVRLQRRAAELEPHTGQIHRQLELFEKSVQEKGPGKPFVDNKE
jgi:tetratricopeptide (TPR) repeat protein